MNKNNIFLDIEKQINSKNNFQPILFLWENIELLNKTIYDFIIDILNKEQIDKNYLNLLKTDEKSLKIEVFKEFIKKSFIKPSFKFQFFFIEEFEKSTIQTFNASLKFLEEPWEKNIVFLTSKTTSLIPETVLSRLKIIELKQDLAKTPNNFYLNLIDNYITKKDVNLINYFFTNQKLESNEYIDFLNTLKIYLISHYLNLELLSLVENSINLIEKNNVLPKNIIDKILLKI